MTRASITAKPLISRRAALVGVAAAACAPRAAVAARRLRFVASGSFAPFNMTAPDGKVIGVYAEALALIGARLGLEIVYQTFPWLRAQRMVHAGEADGYVTRPTPERRALAAFAENPLVSVRPSALITRRGARVAAVLQAATRLDDLRGFRVGGYRGSSVDDKLFAGWPTRHIFNDVPAVLRALDADRIDFTLQVEEVARHVAGALGLRDRFEVSHLGFLAGDDEDYHIGVSRALPDAETLIARIEAEQERLRAEGAIDRILRSFL